MAEVTGISWCDRTWSPWIGCQKVSPACDGCYAEHLMDTRMGRVEWGPHGKRVRTSDDYWQKLRTWDRQAAKSGKPITVFPSLCDPFDNKAPPGALRDFFDEIRATPHLTYLLLTKRPGNIERLFAQAADLRRGDGPTMAEAWPRNAAIGCTVVTQEEADRDIPHLLRAKGALKPAFAFLSMEPLLGPVDLSTHLWGRAKPCADCTRDADCGCGWYPRGAVPNEAALDWVITGGETDQGTHKARPTHPDWILSLRDQCAAAGVPFHFKQHGEWLPVRWMGEDLHEAIYAKPPRRDPEAIRRCKVESTVMHRDGSLHPDPADGLAYASGSGAMLMFKVGKKRSGRLLDGVLHDARPEVRA